MTKHENIRPPVQIALTAREAATLLQLNERTIRRAISRGDLVATKWGGVFRIEPGELARFRAARHGIALSIVPQFQTQKMLAGSGPIAFHLPSPLDDLIGREHDISALLDLLRIPAGPRLIALTGPGGVGKTRLALAIAPLAKEIFADGVAFISLAAIHDPALVPPTIAKALDIRETGERPLTELMAAELAGKHILVIIDNFEQVAAAAPCVGMLLAACPRLTILVTSRSRLRLTGERVFPVNPLAIDSMGDRGTETSSQHSPSPAVQLFAARSQALQPSFRLNDENVGVVTDICRHLDGLPLAIELAAARTPTLTPVGLLARMGQRLPLLSGGPLDLPPRQKTMRNAIAWSYDLLPPEEQALFRRLSVFVGGFTLEAAEAIAADGCTPLSLHVLNLITSLVDKSLLHRVSESATKPRLAMLETVREFGWEQLQARKELNAARERHAVYFLNYAEDAERRLRGPGQVSELARLEAEHDNLRAALTWSLADPARSELALRLAGALHWFWYLRDHYSEGRRWLQRALAQDHAQPPTPARVKALVGAGFHAFPLCDFDAARALLQEAISLGRALHDREGLASALHFLALGDLFQVEGKALLPIAEESVALYREMGDCWGLASSLCTLGIVHLKCRESDAAVAPFAESLHLARASGDTWGLAFAHHYSGELARLRGEFEQADALYDVSFALYRQLEHRGLSAIVVYNRGHVAAKRGFPRLGAIYFAEALAAHVAHGDQHNIAHCLGGIAGMAAVLGCPERASRLFGTTDMLLDRLGISIWPVDEIDYNRHFDVARAALGEVAFDAEYAAGWEMPLEQAIAEAMAMAELAQAMAMDDVLPIAGERPFNLTPRERDVLRLLAMHATNREIANKLSISPRTVMHHVSQLLSKLGVSNRRDAAAMAARFGVG